MLFTGMVVFRIVFVTLMFCFFNKTRLHAKAVSIAHGHTAENCNRRICVTDDCVQSAKDLIESIDTNINPCDDFYKYSCGNYALPSVPIELTTEFLKKMKRILDHSYLENIEPVPKEVFLQVRHAYQNCINDTLTEKQSTKAFLKLVSDMGLVEWPYLKEDWSFPAGNIYSLLSLLNVMREDSLIGLKHFEMIPCHNDSINCSKIMEVTIAGSRPLLDIQVYTGNDTKCEAKQEQYREMFKTLFAFFEVSVEKTESYIEEIFQLEERLASLFEESRNRFLQRRMERNVTNNSSSFSFDPDNLKTKLVSFVKACMDRIDLNIDPKEVKISIRDTVLVKQLIEIIDRTPQRIVANYLVLRMALNHAYEFGYFVHSALLKNEVFRSMNRMPVLEEKWEVCVGWCMDKFTPLFGYIYEMQYLNANLSTRVTQMYNELKSSFLDIIESVHYLNSDTKMYLKAKISNTQFFLNRYNSSNFPIILENYYRDLKFEGNTFLENTIEHNKFTWSKKVRMVYDEEKRMSFNYILGINARAREDMITVGVGFLQYPLFGSLRGAYVDVAKIGQIMAHEMVHVLHMALLDYENITLHERQELIEFHKCLSFKYFQYDKDLSRNRSIDGNRTFDENFADLLGVHISFLTFQKFYAYNTLHLPLEQSEKIRDDQLFFILYAQTFCEMSERGNKNSPVQDPHSPSKYRVLGPLSNFKPFADAFNCNSGSEMNPVRKCIFT